MNKLLTLLLLFITLCLASANPTSSPGFIENKGQVVDMNNEKRNEFLFYSKSENLDIYFRKEGITYIFRKGDKVPNAAGSRKECELAAKEFLLKKTLYYRLDLDFTNHSNSIDIVGEDKQDFYTNYYLPQCPDGLTSVSNYSTVKYKNVYKGIDFKFYVQEGKLKYDIILQPQANINDINLTFNGANDLAVLNNIITIQSPVGLIEESLPKSFVINKNGKEEKVEVAYALKGNMVQFKSTYDVNQTLVIDPQLSWTTYYDEVYLGTLTSVDVKGNQFVISSSTMSTLFPTLNPGASAYYQNALAGSFDYLLIQFDTNSILQWATYYGGSGFDFINDVKLDYAGNSILIGTTASTNIPTQNAGGYYDSNFTPFVGFGSDGGCIFKFNSSGVRQWGTYYDYLTYAFVDIDLNNNIYIAGQARYTSPPVLALAGAYNQAAIANVNPPIFANNSSTDIFILKFDASTNRIWATNFGSSSDEQVTDLNLGSDNYLNIVSLADNYYGTGIITQNAGGYFDNVLGAGTGGSGTDRNDGLIYRFDPSGALVWGTAFGGSKIDMVNGITTDSNNNIYIIGSSQSNDIPFVNPGSGAYFDNIFSTTYNENEYLAKFNSATQLLWSTYFGGASTFVSHNQFIGINNANNLVAITSADQNTYPLVPRVGDYNGTFNTDMDTYIAEFDNNLAIAWSTYFGSTDREIVGDAALSNDGCGYTIYTTSGWQGGATTSPPWVNPGTGAYFDNTYSAGGSALIAKFSGINPQAPTGITMNTACTSSTLSVNGSILPLGSTWNWYTGSCGGTAVGSGSVIVVSPTLSTTYYVRAEGLCGSTACVTVAVNSNLTSSAATSINTTTLCSVNNATLSVNGGNLVTGDNWQWYSGACGGIVIGSGTSIVVSPTVNTTYYVRAEGPCGNTSCVQTAVSLANTPTISLNSVSNATICSGGSSVITPTGAVTYTLLPGGTTGTSFTVSPTSTTIYTISGTNSNGCVSANTDDLITTITVNSTPTISLNSVSSATICSGGSSIITPTGAVTYTLLPGGTTGTSFTVNPVSTTVYTISGTTSNGCVSTSTTNLTTTITVSGTPTITLLSISSNTICSGETATITPGGATTYTLMPGNISGTSFTVNPTITTSYTISGSIGAGCVSLSSDNLALTVTVNSTPTISLNSVSNATICSGGSSVITPTGAVTYTLLPGGTTGTSFTVSPTSTTIYTISGTNAGGCVSATTDDLITTITVNTTPTITAASINTSTICLGTSAVITPTGAATYTLLPGGTIGTSFTVSPGSTTTYTISGTSSNGCVSSGTGDLTTTITVVTTPTITMTSISSNTLCLGSSAVIVPGGAINYTLQPGNNTGTSFTVNPTITTSYTISGSIGAGCVSLSSDDLTFTVTVNSTPTISLNSVSNATICSGGSSVITPTGAVTYTLLPGGTTGTSFTVSPTSTTIYTISGTNASGCVSATTDDLITTITVSNISIIVTSSVNVLCYGSNTGSVSITTNGGIPTYTYQWSNGANTPTVGGLVAGIYTVIVSDAINCNATQTISISEPTSSLTISSLSVTSSCAKNTDGAVSLVVTGGTPNYTVLWNTGSTGTELTNVLPGMYTVTVTDNNGCILINTILVPTLSATDATCEDLFIPEIFSPNGDGKNEKFEVKKISFYPNNTLKIFNRWGSLVYLKKGYNNDWDGTSNIGDAAAGLLPAGTYYVVLDFGDGDSKPYHGYVQLVY